MTGRRRVRPLLQRAREAVAGVVREGDQVLDATVGNGHDTVFLARLVGEQGRVYGIDLQAGAIASTRQRLVAEGLDGRVRLVLGDHARVEAWVPDEARGRVAAIMFNLGYLPGGSRGVVTRPDSTLASLESLKEHLRPGGLISVMCYTGHPGGREETDAVKAWMHALPVHRFSVRHVCSDGVRQSPPELILIERT